MFRINALGQHCALLVGFLCAGLLIPVYAQEYPRMQAVIDGLGDGVHDLRNQRIRCDDDRRVGVRISDQKRASFKMDRTTFFEGCDIALMIEPGTKRGLDGTRLRGEIRIEHQTVQSTGGGVCIWDGGYFGYIGYNLMSGCHNGIVESGAWNQIEGNVIQYMSGEGIVVTGYVNSIRYNTITNNGGEGINIMASVPQRGAISDKSTYSKSYLNDRFLLYLTSPASSNEIFGNYVRGNAKADLRQWPDGCPEPPDPHMPDAIDTGTNHWHDNNYGTKYPACLD